jgi:hypothetical protein
MREWRYSTAMLDLDTGLSLMVNFMPQPLTTRERVPDTRWRGGLVGPRARMLWRKAKSLSPIGYQTLAIQTVAITTPTELSWDQGVQYIMYLKEC